ncbi:hypothetical protein JTB14_033566 [Gonioctena quinquepunctata]|nr:hypothetical protein JTB14_033566 [Gonioctena quinquepunctata]
MYDDFLNAYVRDANLTVRLDTIEEKTDEHSTSMSMINESIPGLSTDAQPTPNELIAGTSSGVQPPSIGSVFCNSKQIIMKTREHSPKGRTEEKSAKGRKEGGKDDTPEKEAIGKQKETSGYKKKPGEVNIVRHQKEIYRTSENEVDPPNPVSTDDDDSVDEECLYCSISKEVDRSGEKWCR